MSKSLNTFAVVLLAFPFYLAQKGRLANYINLAKPTAGNVPPSKTAANATRDGKGSLTAATTALDAAATVLS